MERDIAWKYRCY